MINQPLKPSRKAGWVKLCDAAEIGDVTTLNAIAEEIKVHSDTFVPLSRQIALMGEDFDLDGIQKLADDLDAH